MHFLLGAQLPTVVVFLISGAHFGEISVLYGCKRTATVMSSNYCTLAALTKTKLNQLQVYFEKIITIFK